jgi:hypothetical protein
LVSISLGRADDLEKFVSLIILPLALLMICKWFGFLLIRKQPFFIAVRKVAIMVFITEAKDFFKEFILSSIQAKVLIQCCSTVSDENHLRFKTQSCFTG